MIFDHLLKEKTTHYARLQLISVILPGIVLLSQAAYWAVPRPARADVFTLLRFLSDHLEGVSTGVLIYLMILFVMLGYIAGFLVRYFAFRFINASFRVPTWQELAPDVEKRYAEKEVDWVFSAHPVLTEARVPERPAWGLLGYCKRWLNLRNPALSIDSMEFEISTLVGFTAPLVLTPFIVLDMWLENIAAARLVGIAMSLPLAAGMLATVFTLKKKEYTSGLRNFLISHWIAAHPPPPPNATPP